MRSNLLLFKDTHLPKMLEIRPFKNQLQTGVSVVGGEAGKVKLFGLLSFKARGVFGFGLVFRVLSMYRDLVGSTDCRGLCVHGFLFSWLQVLGNICFEGGRRVSHVLFLLFPFIFEIL